MNYENHSVQSYPDHDCYVWNRKHYHLSPEYSASVCGTCGKIIGFRWRKWSDRIRSLFTDEPKFSRTEMDVIVRRNGKESRFTHSYKRED